MATAPLLEARGLTKHYPVGAGLLSGRPSGVVKAVDGVDFSIGRGETLALVGESGCGKTTTAKLILRLEQPTSGQVRIEGEDIHALKGAALRRFRTRVQAVFQDPWSSLNPRMRVRDLVAEPLVINERLSRKEVDHRVDRVLRDVGLRPEQARNFPHEFSGGQRQRIAIASALISNPRLIVLDEPVSALDVSIRAQIMNLFKDLQQEYDVSYLLVAHDLATTRYMADQIAVMYLGRIVEHAASEDLFEDPKHPYTRALLSAALPGHPDDQHEEVVLPGEVPSPMHPPPGCRFNPRCPAKIGAICERETPAFRDGGAPRHRVACHLYPEEQGSAV
ncbi:MAG TPA: oligopeptide/dipeptide ABC transporter ATP-binding protein [Gemmatimonadales bacterium]|nr:oligopeptide/dipeptide ABC transporter ATP-binding protein [Gemmatimonadales bacterium]